MSHDVRPMNHHNNGFACGSGQSVELSMYVLLALPQYVTKYVAIVNPKRKAKGGSGRWPLLRRSRS